MSSSLQITFLSHSGPPNQLFSIKLEVLVISRLGKSLALLLLTLRFGQRVSLLFHLHRCITQKIMYPLFFWLTTRLLGLVTQIESKIGSPSVQISNTCFRPLSARKCNSEWRLRRKAKVSMAVFSTGGISKDGIVRRLGPSRPIGAATVMTRIEDLMAGMDKEVAIRIEFVALVVDEAEAITVIEVGGEAALVEAEVAAIEEGEVGKEEPTNRSMMWDPVVVATMHREASQTTMITYRAGIITLRRFLPWAAEAYLMASKSVRYFLAEIPVRDEDTVREEHCNGSFNRPQTGCSDVLHSQLYRFLLMHYVCLLHYVYWMPLCLHIHDPSP